MFGMKQWKVLSAKVSLGMKVQVRLLKKDDWKQKKVIGVACAE